MTALESFPAPLSRRRAATGAVLFVNVRDVAYPRHERVASYFSDRGWTVRRIEMQRYRGPAVLRPIRRVGALLVAAWRSGRCDAVVLSEFSVQYAPVTWLIARLAGAVHVVDGFIGLHETQVEDRGHVGPATPRARLLAALDRMSYRLSDVFLVDTDARGAAAVHRFGPGTEVVVLPVGCPPWVRPAARRADPGEPLRVLYYGNFVPLHGVEYLVEALSLATARADVALTLVGRGQSRASTEQLVATRGLGAAARFVEPVSPADLMELVADHDVVVGVFGTSQKAATVIPNKVWQGLGAGVIVVTRRTDALGEIRELVPGTLVEVDPADASSLSHELVRLADAKRTGHLPVADAGVPGRLEGYVRSRYEALGGSITRRSTMPIGALA